MFSQDCSAVGDTGAVMGIALVLPLDGDGRRTRGVGWRTMRMPL